MVDTTTMNPTVADARLVSCLIMPTTGQWHGDQTVSAAPDATGLALDPTNVSGVEAIGGNCSVGGAKRFITRPSRHLATRST